MAHMFGRTWTSQYGVDPAGGAADTWSGALAGVTHEQIAVGLQETIALGLEWPPSAPRFRAMCIGVPSLAQVRHDLKYPPEQRTPFMRQVWSYMDRDSYNCGDEFRFDRAVNEAYELTCRHVITGGELPPELAGVIGFQKRTKPVPASDATARAELSRIAAIFRTGGTEATGNA
jgi:hypothetical protein